MKTLLTRLLLPIAAALVALTLPISAAAQAPVAFNFAPGTGFTSANVCPSNTSTTGCQIFTNTSPIDPVTGLPTGTLPTVTSSGALRLNSAQQNQHASAWYMAPITINTGFSTAFQFQISNTGACQGCSFPADGMAFVIHGDYKNGTASIGYTGDGGDMSYGNGDVATAYGPGQAITHSLAIELDTFQNSTYGDPNGNHIAVQSCGPASSGALNPNSADHNFICSSGLSANLALVSLPPSMSLSDGLTHTLTVNYLPPGNCLNACNNFSIYLDSNFILGIPVDLQTQLSLDGGAYFGFTSATGDAVENNDIVSWSFSQLPLAPITITQPIQPTTTTFNFTPNLSATVDYSQSGLASSTFNGVFMQSTIQGITDQQYADLVTNTPFQGSTCLHQSLGNDSLGNPVYQCVTTTDLCTKATNSTPAGANCPGTLSALIGVTNTYIVDPTQKPIIAPGYLMGTDTALSCGASADNTCKGLINIFTSITGDPTTKGKTKNFNSTLIPVEGVVQPTTTATTVPPLNNGWTNGPVAVNFQSTEVVPSTNLSPFYPLPTITGISYSVAGVNLSAPASGTIVGPTGAIAIPATAEGATVVTYGATDAAGTNEAVVTNAAGQVSTALPMLTINVDKTAPTIAGLAISPAAPAYGQTVTASFSCADSASGVVLCGAAGSSAIPPTANTGTLTVVVDGSVGTHTFTVKAVDQAGNTSTASVNYTVSGGMLSITPSSVAFGNVRIGHPTATIIYVSNTGNMPVTFKSIKLTQTESDGGKGSQFAMLAACPTKLKPGKTCGVIVGFLPSEIVSAAGTITFVDDAAGSPQLVQITGNVTK